MADKDKRAAGKGRARGRPKAEKVLTKTKPMRVAVHVVSDATGTGVERMARAALVQFRGSLAPVFTRHSFIKGVRELEQILDLAEAQHAVVIYTINDQKLRSWLDEQQYVRDVELIDMLGPLLRRIGRRYRVRPHLDASLLPRALGDKALKLSQCIDFTLAHDDGKGLDTLGQADVILLGVSRTSKTPTSVYLSIHHCLKVANIPLVKGVEPPAKIFKLKRPRKVGLVISASKLAQVRRRRFKENVLEGYYDVGSIAEELAFAETVFAQIPGIQVIDVTDHTVEEVANLIAAGTQGC